MRWLARPEYLYRPSQIARRVLFTLTPWRRVVIERLPWGLQLGVDRKDAIGRAVLTTGVYDLPLTEALWRLTGPGDLAVDAGANIGYTLSVLATRAYEVHAFEPHPAVFITLEKNSSIWHTLRTVIVLHQAALSDAEGEAELFDGDAFAHNRGTASLARRGQGSGARRVPTTTLDALKPGESIGVLKIDVEGHEEAVLRGAAARLARKDIRDIVYEDHSGYPSAVSRLLEGYGYTVLHIGGTLRRLVLTAPAEASIDRSQPPNFLATIDPDRARRLCAGRGWKTLG